MTMATMIANKRILISNLYKKFGFEDPLLNQLIELLFEEEEKLQAYRESVCDTVNSYHNEKKELVVVINDLITVLNAVREYDPQDQNGTRQQLLWDTGSEVLLKAQKVLNTI